jgi:photosystem II stability/assembly factor-like uncharacterized protein
MPKRVLVLIGTKKGTFIAESDTTRKSWKLRGPLCSGTVSFEDMTFPMPLQTLDVNFDPKTQTLYSATAGPGGNGNFEGQFKRPAAIWRSTDLGETWIESTEGLTYGEGGPELTKIWNVQPTNHGVIYAGVEPAGLFKSTDGGATWQHVEGLTNHPSRSEWGGGNGGLCLHSIVVHPTDPNRIWVGTSAAGGFYTADGGTSWSPINKNVRNFDTPAAEGEVSGCVHKLRGALNGRDLLYQQNHFGVYRTYDAGQNWQEISAGLPSDFGFGMAVHPHDHKTIYVIPLQGDGRFMPEGKAAVWRSRDSGDTWTRQDKGLPQEGAFVGVLRDGMANDTLDDPGIYFGTNTGEVFCSPDAGETWNVVAGYLPPVLAVETAVIDG